MSKKIIYILSFIGVFIFVFLLITGQFTRTVTIQKGIPERTWQEPFICENTRRIRYEYCSPTQYITTSVFDVLWDAFALYARMHRTTQKITPPPLLPYTYTKHHVNTTTYESVILNHTNINQLRFYYKKDDEKITNINALKIQEKDLTFAMNAGIFSTEYEPLGLYIEQGKTLYSLNTKEGEGNFYLQPNGVFFITKDHEAKIVETSEYDDTGEVLFATQSGPLLLINNEINPLFSPTSTNTYVRNGVGIDGYGNVVFAISNTPVTFYDFANFFKEELHCTKALYLDGAISEMYVPEKRPQNHQLFGVMIGIVGGE